MHRHSEIAMMAPLDVHSGRVEEIVEQRAHVLRAAHQRHPERFVRGAPAQPRRPQPAWINPPNSTHAALAAAAH